MASAPGASAQRVVHQDYIVRQRYSNALPPPAGAPKLLNIESDALKTYTHPTYALRMAREQPINIEADAFLGMPIDLVGMPGVFDGDESSIQAPLVPPPVHPRDRSLLRPLKSLGKPKNELSDISFLRRTQYVAGDDRSRIENANRTPTATVKRRKTDATKEEPMTILRSVIKGFDLANPQSVYTGPASTTNIRGLPSTQAEIEAWKKPKHPTKPHLKMLDSYPILPDLDAIGDDGGFAVVKFNGNPTDLTNRPDLRMEAGLLRPLDPTKEAMTAYQSKLAAHRSDPEQHPEEPQLNFSYEFFLPADDRTAGNVKLKFDVDNPDKDAPELYTNSSAQDDENDSFRFEHLRVYETGLQANHRGNPYQEVALALHDPELAAKISGGILEHERLQKAAYYYPILMKQQLKPRRNVQLHAAGPVRQEEEEAEKIDVVEVTIDEPNEEDTRRREAYAEELDTKVATENGA